MLLWWNESLYCLEIMGWKNDNTVGKSKCGWTGDEPLCMCVLPVCMFQPCSILWPLWGLWSWWKTSGDSRPPLKGLWFWNSVVRASLYCASFRVHCATLLPIGNKSLNISWLYCWRPVPTCPTFLRHILNHRIQPEKQRWASQGV